MEVIANNIANANSTQSSDGGPYRRQQLIFSAAVDDSAATNFAGFRGVEVVGQVADDSELPQVYNPNHEHADPKTGMVTMPNIQIPNEMVDLITASRSYEANLKAMTTFKEMVEQTLRLLRGGV